MFCYCTIKLFFWHVTCLCISCIVNRYTGYIFLLLMFVLTCPYLSGSSFSFLSSSSIQTPVVSSIVFFLFRGLSFLDVRFRQSTHLTTDVYIRYMQPAIFMTSFLSCQRVASMTFHPYIWATSLAYLFLLFPCRELVKFLQICFWARFTHRYVYKFWTSHGECFDGSDELPSCQACHPDWWRAC